MKEKRKQKLEECSKKNKPEILTALREFRNTLGQKIIKKEQYQRICNKHHQFLLTQSFHALKTNPRLLKQRSNNMYAVLSALLNTHVLRHAFNRIQYSPALASSSVNAKQGGFGGLQTQESVCEENRSFENDGGNAWEQSTISDRVNSCNKKIDYSVLKKLTEMEEEDEEWKEQLTPAVIWKVICAVRIQRFYKRRRFHKWIQSQNNTNQFSTALLRIDPTFQSNHNKQSNCAIF